MADLQFLLALFGLWVILRIRREEREGFAQGCLGFRPGGKVDCAAVVSSPASRFLGVSNLVWGGLFYATLAGLALVRRFVPEWSELATSASYGAIAAGLVYTAYLVWYQHAVVRRWCPLCLTSAATVTALAATALAESQTGVSFSLPLPVLGAASLTWALVAARESRLGLLPVVPPAGSSLPGCGYDPGRPTVPGWHELLHPDDPAVGPADADVVVVEVFDPYCPHCRAFFPEFERVVSAFADRVRFVFLPLALWPFSVPAIEALHVAHEHGRFLPFLATLFAHARRGGLEPEEVLDHAERSGVPATAVADAWASGRWRGRVLEHRRVAESLGIVAVPSVLVDGKMVAHTPQAMTARCLAAILEAELDARRDHGTPAPPARDLDVAERRAHGRFRATSIWGPRPR